MKDSILSLTAIILILRVVMSIILKDKEFLVNSILPTTLQEWFRMKADLPIVKKAVSCLSRIPDPELSEKEKISETKVEEDIKECIQVDKENLFSQDPLQMSTY